MKKYFFVLLVLALIMPMGLFAESRLGISGGWKEVHITYYPSGTSSSSSPYGNNTESSDDRAYIAQLDYDYLFNKYIAVSVQGDVGFSYKNNIAGTHYTPTFGYSAKAGVNFYLSFLRVGTGIRYQVTRGGYDGGIMSVKSLLIPLNVDILINIGSKNTLVFGAEYSCPLSAAMVGKSNSGDSMKTSLNLQKKFLEAGSLSFYAGLQFRF